MILGPFGSPKPITAAKTLEALASLAWLESLELT